MTGVIAQPAPGACANNCESATSIEALNRACYCLSLDEKALRGGLEADLGARGLSATMAGAPSAWRICFGVSSKVNHRSLPALVCGSARRREGWENRGAA